MLDPMSNKHTPNEDRAIGEIAAAAGLTIRTLHYYEEIGLLRASKRTEAGHRIYTEADVTRLYRIKMLRSFGLPLSEIVQALDDPAWDLKGTMTSQLAELERRIVVESRLGARLKRLLASEDITLANSSTDMLSLLEEMAMIEQTVENRVSILVYEDLEQAFRFLQDAFALGPGELRRDTDGTVAHGEIEAGNGVIWLHPESDEYGLSSPKALGGTSSTIAVMVADVDAHFQHAREFGVSIVYDPVDQPYGYREYSARDLEGHLWSFMKRLT